MKWFKSSFSRTVASIMAILPTVSWSSACNTSDVYGCPAPDMEDELECCQTMYENQVYEKLCKDLVREKPTGCRRSCSKDAEFIMQIDCAMNTCGELNTNEASEEWQGCADASLNDINKCLYPWNSTP